MPEPKKWMNHVVFNVNDLDAAVKFYTEVVGMKLVMRFDDRKMAFMSFGERHHDIGLFQVGGTEVLDTLQERLVEKGAKMDNLEGHAGGRHKSVYFFDPDGNRLEFYWENPDWKRESADQVRDANKKQP